ncbi:MAG TPA: hypothetical protein VEI97_04390 [bacterium]|nr:hypothetical protein [bacterium]
MAGFMNFMIFVVLTLGITIWAATHDPSWFFSPVITAIIWASSGKIVDMMTGNLSEELSTFRRTVAFEPGGGFDVVTDKYGKEFSDKSDASDEDFLY